jgi:uncharacterized membrane protein
MPPAQFKDTHMTETAIQQQSVESKLLPYVANLAMIFFFPVGVIIAYIDRGNSAPWIRTHYDYLLGTFWKAVVLFFINALLTFVLIGVVTSMLTGIWYLVRVIKSFVRLANGQPIDNPRTWWI